MLVEPTSAQASAMAPPSSGAVTSQPEAKVPSSGKCLHSFTEKVSSP